MRWKNKAAVKAYRKLSAKYGPPSNKDLALGGLALWKRSKLRSTCFEEILLRDEDIPHCAPYPHRDFLYTYVRYEIPIKKIMDVLSLSGSVSYDPLKKLLRARCASEEANIATLYLATSIGNGEISIKKVQREQLYKKAIDDTSNSQKVAAMYHKLCNNLHHQPGDPKITGVFKLAFPKGCCKGYSARKTLP